MFSRKDLISFFVQCAADEPIPLETAEYWSQDFESPSSEESILALRGWKRDFPNAMLFWIKALQAQDWAERDSQLKEYVQSGLCISLSQSEFNQLVREYSQFLRRPLPDFLSRLDGFKAGMKMRGDWNDVATVAELSDSYVAFFWSTTA